MAPRRPAGLWARIDDDAWQLLNQPNPEAVAAANLDGEPGDELIADHGPAGVWRRDASWRRIPSGDPQVLGAGDFRRPAGVRRRQSVRRHRPV